MASFPVLAIVSALTQATAVMPDGYQQACQQYAYMPPEIIGQSILTGRYPDGRACRIILGSKEVVETQFEYEDLIRNRYYHCLDTLQKALDEDGEESANLLKVQMQNEQIAQCQFSK